MLQQLRKPILWLVALNVLLIGSVWWWWANQSGPDWTEVMKLNLHGVGWMDKFEYDKAIPSFEEAASKAPHWLPARINLGIAYMNEAGKSPEKAAVLIPKAIAVFDKILQEDAKNPHAHFCLGMVLRHRKDVEKARAHFRAVIEQDPNDANTMVWLASTLQSTDDEEVRRFEEEKKSLYERAFAIDPNNNSAILGLAASMQPLDSKKAAVLFDRFTKLEHRLANNLSKDIYSAMGKYALAMTGTEVGLGKYATPIGGEGQSRVRAKLPLFDSKPEFKIRLAEGVRWATEKDFGAGAEGDLHRAIRQRFGSALAVLDFDQDQKPDLFLAGGVVENGKVRDLLLRNEGWGNFKDVTRDMGLADHPPSWGAYAADYDNDGYADLLLMGPGHPQLFRKLFRNQEKTAVSFKNVTKKATLDTLNGVFLGAVWVDLDQDGDLDLLLAQYAVSAAEAVAALNNAGEKTKGGLAVFLNTGGSPPQTPEEVLEIDTEFKQTNEPNSLLKVDARLVNLAIADLDHDRDLDLLPVGDHQPVRAVLNDRLLQFHPGELPKDLIGDGPWNGILTLDSRQKEKNDLFLASPTKGCVLLLNQSTPKNELAKGFSKGVTDAPAMLQARAADIDLDGLIDVVGLSSERKPILLHNDGERLARTYNILGLDDAFPSDGLAIAVGDLDGDHIPDVLFWSEAGGLTMLRNLGNGNNSVQVLLTGRRMNKKSLRCNNDAVGVKVRVHAQSLATGGEIATNFAGLGQSHQPLLFGIGPHSHADIIRLRWPDNVWQGEMNRAAKQLHKIPQENRMPDSCPLLFTWDGERYVFISDFLGGGAIGETMPDRSHRPPRPEESVKIESPQLKPKDGKLFMKISEPMDEVTYLDRMELVVVDHPAGVKVYPEERFTTAAPSQDLHGFNVEEVVYPLKASDHRGRDVTSTLRHWDRNMVDGFLCRSWLGYAEDHFVELDFADQLAKFGPKERMFLCLAGWTDYPYPEAMWAAQQAEVALNAPALQRQTTDGKWETIVAELGFPAGRPRMMMVEVTGKVHGAKCVLRIPTSMQVYWDQIFLAPIAESATNREIAKSDQRTGSVFYYRKLPVASAQLAPGYVLQEFSPDGKQPTMYNFAKPDTVPVGRQSGRLTRFGDVKELLTDDDDRFVVFAAGDELTVTFDAAKLAPTPKGWMRSYVLRTAGYCKSMSPFTATGDTIEPLPFRAMSNFPYGPGERYPQTPLHLEYLRKYQTRAVGGN